MSSPWQARVDAALDRIHAAGQWRSTRTFDAIGPAGVLHDPVGTSSGSKNSTPRGRSGRDVVSFASNDYLGLAAHPTVCAAAHGAIDRWGTGATASRLIVGTRPCHHDLEAALAEWKGTERALVFSSGFAANLGVLTTFAGPDVTVLSDELNHASIIDGCRLSRARVEIYRHGDAEHLGARLDACSGPTIVVTDSVFSMDGDLAPLDDIAERCARRGAMLVVDEAHDVFDRTPPAFDGLDVIRVGTMSKTLGSLGGFVAGPARFVDLLVNRARSFVFTTGLTPADTAAAAAAVTIVRSPEGDLRRARLRAAIDRLRPGHGSPIVPLVIGEEAAALEVASRLLERGVLVPAIRPPTVPAGTSRLRVALSAAHTDDQLDLLVDALGAEGLYR